MNVIWAFLERYGIEGCVGLGLGWRVCRVCRVRRVDDGLMLAWEEL